MSHNVIDFNPYETSDVQKHQLGHKYVTEDGDIYRYAKAGASNITSGKLQLAPARKTNHDNVAVYAAAAIGDTKVTVTLGATAATANEYVGGKIVFSDVAPEGQEYVISSHPAADASATLQLTLKRPLVEALTTSSEACLVHNTWNAVVEGTESTSDPAGVPVVDVTASYYCWLMTRGVKAVLADETIDAGAWLTAGTSTAGAVEELDDLTTEITDNFVGKALVAGVDTEYRAVKLEID